MLKIKKLYNKLNEVANVVSQPNLSLAIGNFDGIHLGHQQIISKLKEVAKAKNNASAILTFEPHTACYFKGIEKFTTINNFRINSLSQKLSLLMRSGIDYVFVASFNQDFANMKAESFVTDLLQQKLKIQDLVVGYDFRFGKDRDGDLKTLEKFKVNFHHLDPVKINFEQQEYICSSRAIRSCLRDGNIRLANQMLGRNFEVEGFVNIGQKIASTIGFPTANLMLKPHSIQMKFGTYKTLITLLDSSKTLPAITNFGVKPTLENKAREPIFETHIPNFSANLYQSRVKIEFLDFIREERKFDSLEDLKTQIAKDLQKIVL